MELSEQEKEQLKALIDAGRPLPARYRAVLFEQPQEAELIWPGKTTEVTNVVLPFQTIEQIDEPRTGTAAGTADLFALDQATGRQSGGWTNKLIWGDNKLVLSSLKNGPLRRQIEEAGGLKLVYIDPPFDVGADFSLFLEVGGETLHKQPSAIEEIAYRDTWARGTDSYLSMIYERLALIRDLLDSAGTVFLHIDGRLGSSVRIVLDEIFGSTQFRNDIVWRRSNPKSHISGRMPTSTDYIYRFTKTEVFTYNQAYGEHDEDYLETAYKYEDAGGTYRLLPLLNPNDNRPNLKYEFLGVTRVWRWSRARMEQAYHDGLIIQQKPGAVPQYKKYLSDSKGRTISNLWDDISHGLGGEDASYPTQKPEALLARVLEISSNPGDLVADFFCGSGTTLAVAEKLGRKWIGCDLGRFAIHTARKRLIGVQRELKQQGKPYRSFEILNLGKYERQYFAGIDPTLPEAQRRALSLQKEEHYLTLILAAYKAERVFQSPPFHARKAGALVLVGPVDAPVTQAQVHEAVEAARRMRVAKLDILGFEFEMGLAQHERDAAREKGVALALRYIPKDVFDRRAVEKNQVSFHDVAFVEIQPKAAGRSVRVRLRDFGVFYRQEDIEALGAAMKNGGAKVTVDGGQVVKVSKDKAGIVRREVLTKTWSDWIDYWAVDFDFENRREIVRITEAGGAEREAWTGGYIFENEWQSYRTRKDRALELESAAHEYAAAGRYKIAVKVIDIFGNDTTKVVEVAV